MVCHTQAFPTEKKPEKFKSCQASFDLKKSRMRLKRARFSKFGFKKAKLATLHLNSES